MRRRQCVTTSTSKGRPLLHSDIACPFTAPSLHFLIIYRVTQTLGSYSGGPSGFYRSSVSPCRSHLTFIHFSLVEEPTEDARYWTMTPSGLKPNGLERRADIAPAAARQPAGFSEKVKKVSPVLEWGTRTDWSSWCVLLSPYNPERVLGRVLWWLWTWVG